VEEDAEDVLERQAQQAAVALLHGESKENKNGNEGREGNGSGNDEKRTKVLDMVTCSGYGRDGCLAVINAGVVPDVISNTALPKRSMYTIY
jgi:hypothetical protein